MLDRNSQRGTYSSDATHGGVFIDEQYAHKPEPRTR